jgi:hypothetical protein
MARKSQMRNVILMTQTNVKYTLLITAVLFCFTVDSSIAQTPEGQLVSVVEIDGEEYPLAQLPMVTIVSKREFASSYEQNKYERLKHNVMTVYPYAIEAARIYHEINLTMAETNKRRDKKRYLRQLDNQLQAQFESSLKNLTTKQGEILIKLVSRYTGHTCYDLIKEFKNPMSAFFWQNASKMYGYSLKTMYDPQQDKDIEAIVRSLENTYY